MRRTALALALVTLATLALPTSAARATAPAETGTFELQGIIVYKVGSGTSSILITAQLCIHNWAPAAPGQELGWNCANSFLSDSTPSHTFFDLRGSWPTRGKTYTLNFSLLDVILEPGAHAATGTVTRDGRTGPALLTFVTTPHVDLQKMGYVGTVTYTIP